MNETTRLARTEPAEGWFDAPVPRRLRYFHGQLLGAEDFRREQLYLREKLMLRARHVLGYGVVCGLRVYPLRSDDDHKEQHDRQHPGHHRHRARVRLTSGLGVDCLGHELVVQSGCEVDLWAALPLEERLQAQAPATLWVGIEYAERDVEPTRVVYDDACGGGRDCDFGYTEECFALRVTTHHPQRDRRCDPHPACEDPVLWLARIDDVDPHHSVRAEQVHEEIRRPFGLRVPTVITGVNWIHGHTYSVKQTQQLLGTFDSSLGLRVKFSQGVHTRSLRPGVVDVQVIEGGAGRNASTWYLGGEFRDLPEDEEFVSGFRYRQRTREVLQDGDRVLVTIRTAFILDRCCRPVDGTNVGGRVPLIGGEGVAPEFCAVPPSGIGPWTSGSGAGGGTFESWFFVEDDR